MMELILAGSRDRTNQFYGSPGWTAELKAAGHSEFEATVALLIKSQGGG
jgi:hypothetical protein